MNLNPQKKVTVNCACCNAEIVKTQEVVASFKKEGKIHFCSLNCIKLHGEKLVEEYKEKCRRFEYILSTIEKPGRNLDVLALDTLWNIQDGRCEFTNIGLALPANDEDVKNSMVAAKLVKISKNGGFTKGNVKFISSGISYITDKYTADETRNFISLIKRN